jgi:hypothetical protein
MQYQGGTVEKPEENMVNAGILFMFTAWLQSQMSDLIIFSQNRSFIPDFIATPERVPSDFHKKRVEYWEKHFGPVKNEFKEEFSNLLTDAEKKDVEEIYHLRNMIAHAHVSTGRNYMLYRPFGGPKREQRLITDLNLQPVTDQSDPMVLKLEFWRKEVFTNASNLIERFDQICLKKVADHLGVPHGRIR